MQVKIPPRKTREEKYAKRDINLAMEFAKKVHAELGNMVSAVVIFGSTMGAKPKTKEGDLDILLILDDIRIAMGPEIIETYRIIVQKIIAEVNKERLHVQILHLTSWWGYVRGGDPVAVNILREGFALIDTGFFDPMQSLLDRGAIRPSMEAIWTYLNMSEAALFKANNHILGAIMDLYWAVIDSAHAVLMHIGATPPNPAHMSELLRSELVKKGKLEEKYAKAMEMFYSLSKSIIYKKESEISGKDFDEYQKLATDFVQRMRKMIK